MSTLSMAVTKIESIVSKEKNFPFTVIKDPENPIHRQPQKISIQTMISCYQAYYLAETNDFMRTCFVHVDFGMNKISAKWMCIIRTF